MMENKGCGLGSDLSLAVSLGSNSSDGTSDDSSSDELLEEEELLLDSLTFLAFCLFFFFLASFALALAFSFAPLAFAFLAFFFFFLRFSSSFLEDLEDFLELGQGWKRRREPRAAMPSPLPKLSRLSSKLSAPKSSEDWDKFRDTGREYTKIVRKAAMCCYWKFATDLPDLKAMANFNKMTQAIQRHNVGVMCRDIGKFPTSTEESPYVMMSSSFPESKPILPHHQNVIWLQNEVLGPFMYPEQSFLMTKTIRAAFRLFKNCKSPGPDK